MSITIHDAISKGNLISYGNWLRKKLDRFSLGREAVLVNLDVRHFSSTHRRLLKVVYSPTYKKK